MAKQQRVAIVTPTFGGNTSLDVTDLKLAIAAGWLVTDMAESTNGAILVILEQETSTDTTS
jgi:hypothetical protein